MDIEQELKLRPVKKLKRGIGNLTPEAKQSIKEEVCKHMLTGKSLKSFLESRDGLPSRMAICKWRKEDEEFARKFNQCKEIGFEVIAEDIITIMDEKPPLEANGERIDKGFVFWQNNRAEVRMKLLASWLPRKYGSKKFTEHSGGVALNVITNVPERLEATQTVIEGSKIDE
jgi:hypothetical protein